MILKCRRCEKQYNCSACYDMKEDCKKFKAINKKYLVAVIDLSTDKAERFFTNRKPQAPFNAPTKEEIQAFCNEKNLHNVDADEFINYYESVGWKAGSKCMKKWQPAVLNWDKRQQKFDKEKRTQNAKNRIAGEPSYNINIVQSNAMHNTEIKGI